MNIFFDTSPIFKLYHVENDTQKIVDLVNNPDLENIFLSEIAKIEFSSIVWRKVRLNEFSEQEAKRINRRFESDFRQYHFTQVDREIMAQAKILIEKYGHQGLRTLDSIQLSTAVSLIDECQLFVTSDKLLHSFFQQENLPVV